MPVPQGRDVCCGGRPCRLIDRGEQRISQVPAQTLCRPAHAPSTPEDPDPTRLDAGSDAARGQATALASSMGNFRGSIAWLDRLLSTLQSAKSSRRDARLASHLRGYALVGGICTRRVCCERFQLYVSFTYILLSRVYLDAMPDCPGIDNCFFDKGFQPVHAAFNFQIARFASSIDPRTGQRVRELMPS